LTADRLNQITGNSLHDQYDYDMKYDWERDSIMRNVLVIQPLAGKHRQSFLAKRWDGGWHDLVIKDLMCVFVSTFALWQLFQRLLTCLPEREKSWHGILFHLQLIICRHGVTIGILISLDIIY
jgi:hypothetical protein